LIVEVLLPTTETRNKLEKLAASLVEYLSIAQERVEIGRYTMGEG
jgi:hypothetical protein